MEEAYNTIERLKQRVKELESSGLCVYCGKVSHTKDGQTKLDMMIEHMAECEKHPVAGLLVAAKHWKGLAEQFQSDNEVWRNKYGMIQDDLAKAWSDKRELVSVLEYASRFVKDADTDYIEAHILKHKEGR